MLKIKQSRDWFLRMAKLEEGCEISAGKPIFYPPETLDLETPAKPKRPRKPKARTTATKRRTTTAKSRG